MSNTKILVVDDEPSNLQYLKQVLGDEDYQLVFARDGLEALERLDEQAFALILLDLQMPNLDGYGVLEALRKNGTIGLTKIIILSVLDDEDSVIKGFSLGALDYVPKPFERKELLLRIRRLLNLKTEKETLLAGYRMMQSGVKAVGSLIQTPLDRASRDAEDSSHNTKVQDELRYVTHVLRQFEIYLSLQVAPLKQIDINIQQLLEAALLSCPGTIQLPLQGPQYLAPVGTAIHGDGKMVKNAVLTLLDNASRHTINDEPVKITVKLSKDEHYVLIEIKNRCAGIAQDDIPGLFTPFAREKDAKGFGLDLAIAAAVAQRHGGSVSCESIPNDWTTFTIKLPKSDKSYTARI